MNQTMAMHQANYIPWLGYFYKIAHCDVFVYLDVVQYPRGKSFSAKNRIKTPGGIRFLTIPVSIPKGSGGKVTYPEVMFSDNNWKEKHKKTLIHNYKKAPHFEEIFQIYCECLDKTKSLLDLNIELIERICTYLGISTKRIRLSEILQEFGQKTQLIIDICQVTGSNIYLSGTGGGKEYNDEEKLKKHGIELIYSTFKHPEYSQLYEHFEASLSILDLLFNCGPDSRNVLLNG